MDNFFNEAILFQRCRRSAPKKQEGIMPEYRGNAIYDYIAANNYDYFFCAENHWILVYGNAESIPKIIVFASKADDIWMPFSDAEKTAVNKSFGIAKYLRLPFICVRFMANSGVVLVWQPGAKSWVGMSYEQLRDLYEKYGAVQPGTAKKPVNQYVSSPYHDWQRQNLGRITVSDFDLIKYRNNRVEQIIELKRSRRSVAEWVPYTDDYPNFALLINTIVGSGKNIPFTLFYNFMKDGEIGNRAEDISKIKVFDFVIPNTTISRQQIRHNLRGIYTPQALFD